MALMAFAFSVFFMGSHPEGFKDQTA